MANSTFGATRFRNNSGSSCADAVVVQRARAAATSSTHCRGRPIRVRYRWTVLGDDACRWDQAFSTDKGGTWETNWIADFTRAI